MVDFTIQKIRNGIMENIVWQKILKYLLRSKYFLSGSSIKAECLTFYHKSIRFSSVGWETKITLS